MVSILVFLIVLGILIIVHEFGHFIVAKKTGVRVEKFSLGFGPQIFTRKRKETEYIISAVPLGGYVKLAGDNLEEFKGSPDEYLAKAPGKRAAIVFAGPLLNYILGFLVFWLIFFAGYPALTAKVGSLVEGYGAKDAGIQSGDKIIAVDGTKVRLWDDLQNIIQAKKAGKSVNITVSRGGQELTMSVTIKEKQFDDLMGKKHSVGLIGITPHDETVTIRHGIIQSFILSINKTTDLTTMTYKAIWLMLTKKLSLRESATGPLGIFFITSKAAQLGVTAVLHLIAVLSISLAIFNLLPLPILDGGHILFLGIEKIRGKAFNIKTEQIVTKAGLTLLITLAIVITYNDILRFFGDKVPGFLKIIK